MNNLSQYMKSTDPEIVATIERREVAYQEWRARAFEWARKVTGLPLDKVGIRANGWKTDSVTLVGFYPYQVEGVDLPGGWTKDPVRPKKNNPAFNEFSKIRTYKAEAVRGRPNVAAGGDWFGGGSLFIHDGVAYSGFGFMPDGQNSKDQGEGWEEIKGSEYMAAQEAAVEANQ